VTFAELAALVETDTQTLVERIDQRLARIERLLADPTPNRIWWARWRARR
jgi:hypothetical protein